MKVNRKATFLVYILATMVLNFTSLYIVRMGIHYVYATHDIAKSSAFITIVDKLSQMPFLAWLSIGIALGIVFMSVLVWAIDFGVKDKR